MPQNPTHVVLPKEERAKGFVRPVRRSYKHVGERPKYPLAALTDEQEKRFNSGPSPCGYVAFEEYPGGSPEREEGKIGRYWTQQQLDSGCGCDTTMGQSIAETYARDPEFYGSTYCTGCDGYFPVKQFKWIIDGQVVGS